MTIERQVPEGFLPVITGRQGIDALVRAYVHLVSPWALISYPHASRVDLRTFPPVRLFMDSGAYGYIKYGGVITEHADHAEMTITGPMGDVTITPGVLLELQERHAAVGATLDIPPRSHEHEADALELSTANALWALANRRRRDLLLYGVLPAVKDTQRVVQAARLLKSREIDGIALGNLLPHRGQPDFIDRTVTALRDALPDLPLHVFGFGSPEVLSRLRRLGVTSADSSSYVRAAMAGRLLGATDTGRTDDPSPTEILALALQNIATLRGGALPFRYMLQPPFQKLREATS